MSGYLETGKKLLAKHEYSKALEYFQAAIEGNSSCAEAYLLMSDCYVGLGNTRLALGTIHSLLAIDPTSQTAQRKLERIQGINAKNKFESVSSQRVESEKKRKSIGHRKNQYQPNTHPQTTPQKWSWSAGNIISFAIGIIGCILSLFGIIGCVPLYDSYEWAFFVFFILLLSFSTCMVLAPRIKPQWSAKNIFFLIFGITITPLCVGMLIEDLEHNEMCVILSLISVLFVFAPFIKVD